MELEPLTKFVSELSESDQEYAAELISRVQGAINTPLSELLSSVEQLSSLIGANPTPIQEQYLSTANAACYRMLHLSQELGLLAKIKNGSLSPEATAISLFDLIDDYIAEVEPHLNLMGFAVEWSCPIKYSKLNLDENLFFRLFLSLISYSVSISPKNGVLRIHADAEEDFMIFSVACGGVLDAESLAELRSRIADFKIDANPRNSLGTGLLIANSIAVLHGGSMEINSEETGTTIQVKLKRDRMLHTLHSHKIIYTGEKSTKILLGLADVLPDSSFSPLKIK